MQTLTTILDRVRDRARDLRALRSLNYSPHGLDLGEDLEQAIAADLFRRND